MSQGGLTPLPGVVGTRHVMVLPMADGTAAQIIWYLGEFRIQVSDRVPAGERAAVVLHIRETHSIRCAASDCASARDWLAPRPVVRLYDESGVA